MKCIHLIKGKDAACKALEKAYAPSLFQLVEYCRSGEYRKCPLYLRGGICADRQEGRRSAALSFSGM
jgi:hypothetical protein